MATGKVGRVSRWIAYEVRHVLMGGAGRSLRKLGAVNAPHQPAALMRALDKWPKVPRDKITVRPPPKRLEALIRRGKDDLARARRTGDWSLPRKGS